MSKPRCSALVQDSTNLFLSDSSAFPPFLRERENSVLHNQMSFFSSLTCALPGNFNPLLPRGNNSYSIVKISFLKKEGIIEKNPMSR